jgi:AraC-like DNA-binding protein
MQRGSTVSSDTDARKESPPMDKVVFSSRDLPSHLDDMARLSQWREFLFRVFGPLEVSCLPDRPFSAKLEAMRFDAAGLMRFEGSVDRTSSTSSTIATTMRSDFYLSLTSDPMPMLFSQRGRDVSFHAGTAVLGTCTEPCDMRAKDRNAFVQVVIPHARLKDLVAGADDLVAKPVQSDSAAMRHLRRYVAFLSGPDGLEDDADLTAHVETTLTDLVALALGAGRDVTEMAQMRGLRAARLQDILAEIRTGFIKPGFSPDDIARKLRVTPRYVQNLLQETGSSFTERVLELRLQRTRAMLADPRCDRMKIGEIAEACGFNEIPYFNRCFRRRFGAAPTQYRGTI